MTPVAVTNHAVDRIRERCPDIGENVRGIVVAEVRAAIDEGRRAVSKPRCLVPTGRRPRARKPSVRFVWNPSSSRVYVIRGVRSTTGRRGWLVLTALVPNLPAGFEFDDELEEAAA